MNKKPIIIDKFKAAHLCTATKLKKRTRFIASSLSVVLKSIPLLSLRQSNVL